MGIVGGGCCFPRGVKRLQHEADDSPMSNVEDMNEWSCTSPKPTDLHGGHKDNYVSPFVYDALLVVISDRKIFFSAINMCVDLRKVRCSRGLRTGGTRDEIIFGRDAQY